MRTLFLITGIALLTGIGVSHGQGDDKDLDQVLLEMGKDAAPGYLGPFMNTVGTGMNNGWHNSSKSLSFLGLPIGVSAGSFALTIGQVTKDMETFDFEGQVPFRRPLSDYIDINALPDNIRQQIPETLPLTKENVPTVYGGDEPDSATLGNLLSSDPAMYSALLEGQDVGGVPVPAVLDSNLAFALPFVGLVPGNYWGSLPNITALTIGFKKLPVIDNIQLGISYVPKVTSEKIEGIGKLEFNMLSYKIQHEFSALIPGLNKLKILHASWYWAQNGLSLKSGNASMEMTNWLAMLNASIDMKFLFLGVGAFGGIGYESSSLSLKLKADGGYSGFSCEVPSDRTMRYQLGARASLFIFDVWGEYNMGQINSYTLGVTLLAFNGL